MFLQIVAYFLIFSCQFAMIGPRGPGGDTEDWKHFAVIYAEVIEAKQHDADPINWTITLKPLAALTGDLDPAFVSEFSADAKIGNWTTRVAAPPEKRKKVVVLIAGVGVRKNHHYSVHPGDASMFPANERGEHPCLFEVTGFDDPKVTETIENLRKLRGTHREEAEKNAAAKPAAGSATPPAPPAPVSPAPVSPASPSSAPTPAAPKR